MVLKSGYPNKSNSLLNLTAKIGPVKCLFYLPKTALTKGSPGIDLIILCIALFLQHANFAVFHPDVSDLL